MIENKICPYCYRKMNEVSNDARKSSREHLIAERFFKAKRGMGCADFRCCKECNERKSEMDYIFAVMSRLQSNAEISIEEANDVLSDKKKVKRLLRSFKSMKQQGAGVIAEFPAGAEDILLYLNFLAKGQYFLTTERCFNRSGKMFIPSMYCRGVLDAFDAFDAYYKDGKGRKFDDLRTNPNSHILGASGEVILWQKEMSFCYVLNDTIMIGGEFVKRSNANLRKRSKHVARIKRSDRQKSIGT